MSNKSFEEQIINYINTIYAMFPKYKKYASLNFKISEKILSLYYDMVDIDVDLKVKIDESTAIKIAADIISGIDISLKDKFLSEIELKNIYFGNYKAGEYSCTHVEDGMIKSCIVPSYDLEMVMALVHEFFHFIHLERYNGNLECEEFRFFSEIFAIAAEIYSIFYLSDNKKELLSDIKLYLEEFISCFVSCSEETYVMNMIINIYNETNSLSKRNIKNYVNKNELSDEYLDMLTLVKNFDWRMYPIDILYVFAFPISFLIAHKMYNEFGWLKEYITKFKEIEKYNIEDLLFLLELDKHFYNDEELDNLMENIDKEFERIFNKEEPKIKKIGEL